MGYIFAILDNDLSNCIPILSRSTNRPRVINKQGIRIFLHSMIKRYYLIRTYKLILLYLRNLKKSDHYKNYHSHSLLLLFLSFIRTKLRVTLVMRRDISSYQRLILSLSLLLLSYLMLFRFIDYSGSGSSSRSSNGNSSSSCL